MTNVKYVNRLSANQVLLFFKSQGWHYSKCEKLSYSNNDTVYYKIINSDEMLLLYKFTDNSVESYNNDKITNDAWRAYLVAIFGEEYLDDNKFYRGR